MKTHSMAGAEMLENLPIHQDDPLVKVAETWTEKFEEPEFNEKTDSYIWYGNVGGQKASLVILKNSDTMVKLGQCSMMSLERIS